MHYMCFRLCASVNAESMLMAFTDGTLQSPTLQIK